MYQTETISLVINWSSSGLRDITAKCQDCLFIYLSPRLLSAAVDFGAEPFVLWSNKEEYWFIGVRQLPFASSSTLFRFTIWSPGERSLLFTDAERRALCCCTARVGRDTETAMPRQTCGLFEKRSWMRFCYTLCKNVSSAIKNWKRPIKKENSNSS